MYTKQNILLLGTLVLSFTAFCVETDMYAPSFPDMVAYFATSEAYIQHILTANFIGLFLSTLIYGPLSDSFGRKPLLSAGVGLFALSSVMCMLVSTVDALILWRLVQGLGSGAITGIGTAMVFDAFPKEMTARLIAILNSFVTGVMAFAPLAGSWVNILFGWRMNFVIIAVLAILSTLSVVFLVKETHPVQQRAPFSLRGIFNEYGRMLINPTFMFNTLLWNIMFGLLMVFVANLSLIYIDHLNVSEKIFGFHQASIMATFFVASIAAAQCIAKWGMNRTKWLGNVFFGMGAIALILLVAINWLQPILISLSMSLCSAGVALACAIYYVDAMSEFPQSTGMLAALSQGLRLLFTAGHDSAFFNIIYWHIGTYCRYYGCECFIVSHFISISESGRVGKAQRIGVKLGVRVANNCLD